MIKSRLFVSAALVCSLVVVGFAQDKTKATDKGKGKDDTQNLVGKLEQSPRARFVDFSGELGLQLASLELLGERIDNARLTSNPVELALAAKLLGTAEELAKKKAKLTSSALTAEAIDLAKQRGNASELAVIAAFVDGPAADDLKAVAKAAEAKKPEEGEVSKDLHGDLIVDNHSHSEVHVYVDGYEVGHVHAHNVQVFHVHDAHHAVCRDHFGHKWVAHFEYDHYHRYRMVIHDPHHDHGD